MMKLFTVGLAAILTIACLGCQGGSDSPSGAGPSAAAQAYLLSDEPAGARQVADVKAASKTGEEVVLVGKIAGSMEPFVKDVAAFTLVDLAVPHCPPEEGCPTPWDCCCHFDEAQAKQAMIQVVDNEGNPVSTDARELFGVQGLSEVVVQGKVERDDKGNLTVLANKIFVRK
jgi:hypothetical protein